MRRALLVLGFVVVWVQGCLVPEDTEISLLLAKDGRYKVRASGVLSYAGYAHGNLGNDPLAVERFGAAAVKRLAEATGYSKVAPAPGRRIAYAHEHDGSWKTDVGEPCNPGDDLKITSLVKVVPGPKSTLALTAIPEKPPATGQEIEKMRKSIADGERLGFRFRYTLRLVTDMKVVEHNAPSVEPVEKDPRFRRYVWKDVRLGDRSPRMTIDTEAR